jgi:hypothetical protein
MGEYYSEAIDDNAQRIHLQFGVPEYNSLTNFFARFFDYQVSRMVETGDVNSDGIVFLAAKSAAFLFTLPVQIIIGAASRIQQLARFADGNPYSRFYYMKPTMPLYWSTVSVLLNKVGVNMGLLYGGKEENVTGASDSYRTSLAAIDGDSPDALNKLLPDVFGEGGGGVDVYKMVSRSQRLAAQHAKAVKELGKGLGPEELKAAIAKKLTQQITEPNPAHGNMVSYLNSYYRGLKLAGVDASQAKKPPVMRNMDPKAMAEQYKAEKIEMPMDKWSGADWSQLLTGMLEDGTAFASFNVDYEGSVSESFSNSTKTSSIAEKMASTSSTFRDFRFTFADGNIDGGIIDATVGAALGAVKDLFAGAAVGVGIGGLFGLAGAAFPDIPDVWDNSSANLPKTDYSITLATPYGNKMSIFLNIYIPLCMLLAGALPRSTGKASYGSPFICKLWSQGRNTVQLGMIDSLSITRGTGGIQWNNDLLPTQVEVNFSVVNLNKVMHVPVQEMGGPDVFLGLTMFDEDTAATDYLAALGGLGLYEQYYVKPRISLAVAKTLGEWKNYISPGHWASRFAGSWSGRSLSAVFRASSRY